MSRNMNAFWVQHCFALLDRDMLVSDSDMEHPYMKLNVQFARHYQVLFPNHSPLELGRVLCEN